MTRTARWLSFAVIALLYMQAQFHRIAPAAVASRLETDLGLSGAQLGVLAATYFYVYTALQLPTGLLADRWGPRPLVLGGGLLAGLGSVLFGAGTDFHTVLAGRFVVGVGVAVFFIAYLKHITLEFEPARFATLTGLVVLLGNLGAMSATAPLAWLIARLSWHAVFIGLGVLCWIVTALAWRWVKTRPAEASAGRPAQTISLRRSLATVLRNPATWPPFLACGGIAGSYLTFAGLWATPWLETVLHADAASAGRHGLALLGGFAAGSMAVGWLADRLPSRKRLLIGLSSVYAGVWLLLAVWTPDLGWPSYLVFAALGLSVSAFTLTWSLGKDVNPPAYSGTATSLVNAAAFAAVGILQPVVGWILDATQRSPGGFRRAVLLLALTAAGGCIAGCFCRETPRDRRGA